MKIVSLLALSSLLFACTAETAPDSEPTVASAYHANGGGGGSEPRTHVAPTPKPGVAEKADAQDEAAQIQGRACTTDADCVAKSGLLGTSCATPYYGQSQCVVVGAPSLTCADYDCPAGFECEAETGGSIACVEHRPSGKNR